MSGIFVNFLLKLLRLNNNIVISFCMKLQKLEYGLLREAHQGRGRAAPPSLEGGVRRRVQFWKTWADTQILRVMKTNAKNINLNDAIIMLEI